MSTKIDESYAGDTLRIEYYIHPPAPPPSEPTTAEGLCTKCGREWRVFCGCWCPRPGCFREFHNDGKHMDVNGNSLATSEEGERPVLALKLRCDKCTGVRYYRGDEEGARQFVREFIAKHGGRSDERITGPAIAYPYGGGYACLPIPASHYGVSEAIKRFLPHAQPLTWEQGFATSTGRYVGRDEAYRIADAANQIVRPIGGSGSLTSEELWTDTPLPVTAKDELSEDAMSLARLAEAAADLYCALRREGWEKGPTMEDAANLVMHLVANEGIDVHARLMVWRGEHDDEEALAVHRTGCDGCTICDMDIRDRRSR
jgi:hypothetical protein